MKMIRHLLALFLLVLAGSTHAQNSQAANLNIYLDGTETAKVGDVVTLVIEVSPKTEWHVYSAIASEEGVYRPAELGWEIDSRGFEATGALKEEGHMVSRMDDVLGGTVRYYKDKVQFTIAVKVTEPKLKLVGYFDYMACNEFQCIPFTAEFSLEAEIKE